MWADTGVPGISPPVISPSPPGAKSLGISPSLRDPFMDLAPPPLPTTHFREYSCI